MYADDANTEECAFEIEKRNVSLGVGGAASARYVNICLLNDLALLVG